MRMAVRLYVFTVLILGAMNAHATANKVCEILLSGGKITKPATTVSQAQRLNEMLTKLTPEKRAELYKILGTQNLAEISRNVRENKLTAAQKAALDANPGLDLAVQDLSEF